MKPWSLYLTAFLGVLMIALLCADVLVRSRAAWRRRRRAQGGIYGVVVDATGRVLGVYVDPLSRPHRTARMHGPGSVWTCSERSDPRAWAWEGQAETEEEARHLANRLRHLHLSLQPELRELALPWEDGGEEA